MVRYIKERNGARITELTVGDQAITLRLTDFLADGTYNYPLSVRRELPTGWTDAAVRQAGSSRPGAGSIKWSTNGRSTTGYDGRANLTGPGVYEPHESINLSRYCHGRPRIVPVLQA